MEGWSEYMAFSFSWSVSSLARHWRYMIAAHSGILNVPEIRLQYVKLSKTFQFPNAGAVFTGEQSLHGNKGTALAASHTKQLRLSRSGFFVICKFKGTLKSKQTNKTWSTVIGNFSLLSIRQENIFDIWLFFSCHAFVFEYSSALFSHFWHSPLNKPNEAPWNSLQLSVNIYNNCRSSQRQWSILFGCSQTMTVLVVTRCYMPDSHHPCADICMYHFLHASWQVKCSKKVTHERHWQGTLLRAAGAVWRMAATQPPQLGSASQRSYAKE